MEGVRLRALRCPRTAGSWPRHGLLLAVLLGKVRYFWKNEHEAHLILRHQMGVKRLLKES